MCKIVTGINVKTMGDVQNIIIGVLLRQEEDFDIDEIVLSVKQNIKGSSIEISSNYLREMIEINLDLFIRNNLVRCRNGVYSPQKSMRSLHSQRRVGTEMN